MHHLASEEVDRLVVIAQLAHDDGIVHANELLLYDSEGCCQDASRITTSARWSRGYVDAVGTAVLLFRQPLVELGGSPCSGLSCDFRETYHPDDG